MARFLLLDLETRSTVDLRRAGVFRYAEDPTTDLWCASYAFDDGPVMRWVPGQAVPEPIIQHVEGGGLVRAWNAQFESTLWEYILGPRYHWPPIAERQWVCSAALGARAALPRSLEDAAKALGLPVEKDAEGYRLMLQMCKPRRVEEDGAVVWWTDPAKLDRLMAYCDQDVVVERAIYRQLPAVGSETERQVWLLDQTINRRGVRLDRAYVAGSQQITTTASLVLDKAMRAVTQGAVQRCTQTARLTAWLQSKGVNVTVNAGEEDEKDSIAKGQLRDLLKGDLAPEVREALLLRSEGSKASTAKLKSMDASVCADYRVRGLLLYHGASTGRWSGKLVQPQNFPRGTVKGIERYAPLIQRGDFEMLDMVAEASPMEVISSGLRGCFIPAEGHDFLAADFNAIEARVLAWLAGASKILAAFRQPKPALYAEMGALIFGVSVEEVMEGHTSGRWPLGRWLGKTTILGAGYQMGWKKFQESAKALGDVDLDDDTAERAIGLYRAEHWQIPELWKGLNMAAMDVVQNQVTDWTPVPAAGDRVAFRLDGDWLRMGLPSGRSLWYARPRLRERKLPWSTPEKPASAPAVVFEGVNSLTRKWGRQALYGGLLTENAVQAIARDLMAEAMLRAEARGYPVVLTVHDEILTEVPVGFGSVPEFESLMAELPPWAEGCPVAAEGWRGPRYRK